VSAPTERLFSRTNTNVARALLDDYLPPAVRESAPFRWAVKAWLGKNCIPDFKEQAFGMSDEEFAEAYRKTYVGMNGGRRSSDTTDLQMDWILANSGKPPRSILEIGSHKGILAQRLAEAGHAVQTLDLSGPGLTGCAEHIPLPDQSVDVIVLAHVIEHVRSLTRAFLELARVSREQVLIVTPRQRFYKWTFDYHLHFFYSVAHLCSYAHCGAAAGELIEGDICMNWSVKP